MKICLINFIYIVIFVNLNRNRTMYLCLTEWQLPAAESAKFRLSVGNGEECVEATSVQWFYEIDLQYFTC